MISEKKIVLDASAIIKGVIPPKASSDKESYQKAQKTFSAGNKIMSLVFSGGISAVVPSAVLVEVSAVAARITNNVKYGLDLVEKVRAYCDVLYDEDTLEQSIQLAAETMASGFDTLLIACAKLVKVPLVTDDKKLHNICQRHKINSYLLSAINDDDKKT